jgi:DNA-binding response OmpR family regulator
MINVLLIDDDDRHSSLLKTYLERFGMTLHRAADGDEGLQMVAELEPDLVLLDIMLPGRDGLEVCREIRRRSQLPVVMLTARGDLVDRVSGLELGADDYIAKPFEPRELVARIHTVLRRSQAASPASDLLRFEGLEIDQTARTVSVDGRPVDLTSMEHELLVYLARHPGAKISRDDILNELRGIDSAILTRSVDIMVSRLRQKLGDTEKPFRFIQTAWGVGYRFAGRPVGP